MKVRKHRRRSVGGSFDKSLVHLVLCTLLSATTWANTLPRGIAAKNEASIADRQITGKVTDRTNNEGLPGVNILIKGTQSGTVTDASGKYSLEIPENGATLVFSFVGYLTQEVETGSRTAVDLTLVPDAKALSEVVVVGYGTQKKANLTGSVDQVGQEVLQNRPIPNVAQGLVGAVPNLNIRMLDGKPTQSPSFNIRGTTSIGQGGNALVLIDNVEGDPRMLNPNDIESISVLKDASSASIYGARAA